MSRWLKLGTDFLENYGRRFRLIWLFNSGPTDGTEDADSSVGQ